METQVLGQSYLRAGEPTWYGGSGVVMEYDRSAMAAYFDEFAEREWDRLVKDAEAEVNFAVHLHYPRRYVQPGWRVLDVGTVETDDFGVPHVVVYRIHRGL